MTCKCWATVGWNSTRDCTGPRVLALRSPCPGGHGGRGDSALFNIGHKPVSPAVLEHYVSDVQTYLRGETLDAAGYPSKLRWLDAPGHAKVPLDVAGTGPKVISVGARLADRVSFALGADAAQERFAKEVIPAFRG